MESFTSAVSTLQTLVIALGAGLAVWGVINLLEGYDRTIRTQKAKVENIKSYDVIFLGYQIWSSTTPPLCVPL